MNGHYLSMPWDGITSLNETFQTLFVESLPGFMYFGSLEERGFTPYPITMHFHHYGEQVVRRLRFSTRDKEIETDIFAVKREPFYIHVVRRGSKHPVRKYGICNLLYENSFTLPPNIDLYPPHTVVVNHMVIRDIRFFGDVRVTGNEVLAILTFQKEVEDHE